MVSFSTVSCIFRCFEHDLPEPSDLWGKKTAVIKNSANLLMGIGREQPVDSSFIAELEEPLNDVYFVFSGVDL